MKETYRQLQILLESDPEYLELEGQRQEKLVALRGVLETLTDSQRDAVIDYIGISEEQGWRAVEMAWKER